MNILVIMHALSNKFAAERTENGIDNLDQLYTDVYHGFTNTSHLY